MTSLSPLFDRFRLGGIFMQMEDKCTLQLPKDPYNLTQSSRFATKENTWNEYTNHGVIGKGTFGVVTLAANKRTQELVAIKNLCGSATLDPFCLREVQFFHEVPSHPSLVSMSEMYTDRHTGEVHIVMERMEFNMLDLIRSFRENQPSPSIIASLSRQMLRGLAHIHSLDFVHRDLKPENILMGYQRDTKLGRRKLVLKLADFGLSRKIETPGFDTVWSGYVATRWYRAPEQLLQTGNHGFALDIWSFGTVLAELCNVRPLFPGRNSHEMVHFILNTLGSPDEYNLGGEWKNVSGIVQQQSIKQLIAKQVASKAHIISSPEFRVFDRCAKASLRWDAARRPSANHLLQYLKHHQVRSVSETQ